MRQERVLKFQIQILQREQGDGKVTGSLTGSLMNRKDVAS